MADEYLNGGYTKPHNRVLQPPGGETHDIFGTGRPVYGNAADSPRRSKNYQQSSIFGGDVVDAVQALPPAYKPSPKQAKTSEDMNAIMGAAGVTSGEDRQQRKVKDYFKSNIFASSQDADQINGNATPRRSSSSSLVEAAGIASVTPQPTPRRRAAGGNPITGEGYLNGSTITTTNGEPQENGQCNTRVRNPPGGHSTKLW